MIQQRMNVYSEILNDWAWEVSEAFVRKADRADMESWMRMSKRIGKQTRRILKDTGSGALFHQLQAEQVHLIKSMPLYAAKKVHEWCVEGMHQGTRQDLIADRIFDRIGGVSWHHALLIARTESSRAKANFTQARAMNLGSHEYRWHTVGDSTVRRSHARLNHKIFKWSDPPITDYGKKGIPLHSHPGAIFNCRCWAEPLFPEDELEK